MKNPTDMLDELLLKSLDKSKIEEKYLKYQLSNNPFPRAGISDINSSESLLGKLKPIDENIEKEIVNYVIDSLSYSSSQSNNKYLSLVIRGDYGSGKTQNLLFIKYILELVSSLPDINKKPYVVYIDNPGAKLSELIGSIISQIGEENFKKYLWDILFAGILKDEAFKCSLENISENHLFKKEIFNDNKMISYKSFLNNIFSILTAKQRQKFQELIKNKTLEVFTSKFENQTIAYYFYSLMSEEIGINKTWELLSSGSARELDKKEVYIIRAIVDLVESNGFTDFYILVDEFEDVTVGRLTNQEIDRYITNLRTLIDKERNWCSVFAMTGLALSKLKSISPPLADRIGGRLIDLKGLDENSAKNIIVNYLNLAREKSDSLNPFELSGVNEILNLSLGNLRLFLKYCYKLLQRISETQGENPVIDSLFVKKHIGKSEE
jgi:hypothetical protein